MVCIRHLLDLWRRLRRHQAGRDAIQLNSVADQRRLPAAVADGADEGVATFLGTDHRCADRGLEGGGAVELNDAIAGVLGPSPHW